MIIGVLNPARADFDNLDHRKNLSNSKFQDLTPGWGFEDSLRSLPPRMRPFFDKEYRRQCFEFPLQESLNLRCAGRWPWGPSYEATGQRDTLYLASGSGVRIIDITNPRNPRHIGQVCAKGLVNQVVIRDSLLYVASRGLEIFNVSNPANPIRRSWLNIPVGDFGLKDSFAVCIGDSLRIINIKNPSNPVRVGESADSGWSIFVSGNYAYTGHRWALSIIDISNPANPRYINSRGDYVWAIWVRGNHCYYTTGDGNFIIVNVENPLNLWEEGRLNGKSSYDLYVIDFYAYLANFDVIDVSDSSRPSIIGSCTMPGGVVPFGVWVKSPFTYGFVADWYEGLQVVNINDPTRPRVDTICFKAADARDVFVLNNRAYIADNMAGLKILDISNITAPTEIGCYDTVGQEPLLNAIWAKDTLVFLGDDITLFPNRFAIVNVRDPNNIIRLGSCHTPGNISAEDMFLKDSILYTVNVSYLFGYRVANPSSPAKACSLFVGGDEAYGVFVRDSFAYVNGTRGLKIIKISNLANPVVVSRCTTQSGYGVWVRDTLAYLATAYRGLFIINVKNPYSPYIVDSFITRDDGARDLWIDDTLAYVASWRSFQILNIKDPSNPYEIGYYRPSTAIKRLFYDGHYIYGAAFEGGMIVFERFGTEIEERNKWSGLMPSLLIYPNPTKGAIFLNALNFEKETILKVFDVTGREIGEMRQSIGVLNLKKELDIKHLKSGVYFLILEDGKHKTTFKVIKL